MTSIEYLVVCCALLFGVFGTAWLTNRYDLFRLNFRGVRIPSCVGTVFLLYSAFVYCYEWLTNRLDPYPAAAFLLVTVGFGLLGFFDDIVGNRKSGGFKGHFRELRHGRITTGAIKAIAGLVISLIVSFLLNPHQLIRIMVGGPLIALSANALNLLDLRPGRCLFAFLVGAIIVIVSLIHGRYGDIGILFYLAIFVAAILLPFDSRGLIMLGDTGSNAFGAVLGVAGVLYFSLNWQTVLVLVLTLFHYWTESNSLTRFIESKPILRRIDRMIGVR